MLMNLAEHTKIITGRMLGIFYATVSLLFLKIMKSWVEKRSSRPINLDAKGTVVTLQISNRFEKNKPSWLLINL